VIGELIAEDGVELISAIVGRPRRATVSRGRAKPRHCRI